MHKDELKSLVTQMYDELIESIESQEDVTKEHVVNYLLNSADTISTIDDEKLDTIAHAKLAFTNRYKELADRSLSNYKDTNGRFEELTKKHQKTVNECKEIHIDLPSITEKFNQIQTEMTQEVRRANKVITMLTNQVKQLEVNSNLDPLTKVFNRRALSSYLENACAKKSLKYDLHLLMLDIDDFKSVNDRYGHIAGDKILIFIANMLRKTLRDGDKIFRYGGEEFLVILNRTSTKDCKDIAYRILRLISTNKLIYKGESLSVTLSIGTTKYNDGDTPDSLINRADKALYKSKHNGKNQISTELFTDGN